MKNKKLQRGNIFMFEDIIDKKGLKGSKPKQPSKYKRVGENPNEPGVEQIIKAYETVYLLKWLFPEAAAQKYQQQVHQAKRGKFPRFQDQFLKQTQSSSRSRSSMMPHE